MTKNEKNASDETEKALRLLIERAHNENSALAKILKLLNESKDQPSPSEQSMVKKEKGRKSNN
ncbi:MAG: hypothetical protein RBR28_14480 [Lentimicrobium sp.]|jgi:hypothetical protein|nr:hypothetical protein [Lentimicrobium sp.]